MGLRPLGKSRIPPLRHVLIGALLLVSTALGATPHTLPMTLDGRATDVDITVPSAQSIPIRGTVIIAHGFTRNRHTMAGHAAALAHEGLWVVVPDMPFVVDSRDNARALRDLMAQLRNGVAGAPLDRFVLVGFSAGGL